MLWLPTTRPGEGDDFVMLRLGVAVTVLVLETQVDDGVHVFGVGALAPPVESTDA